MEQCGAAFLSAARELRTDCEFVLEARAPPGPLTLLRGVAKILPFGRVAHPTLRPLKPC